jgi:hypothetical protein
MHNTCSGSLGYLKSDTGFFCKHFWVNKSLSMMWLLHFELGNYFFLSLSSCYYDLYTEVQGSSGRTMSMTSVHKTMPACLAIS